MSRKRDQEKDGYQLEGSEVGGAIPTHVQEKKPTRRLGTSWRSDRSIEEASVKQSKDPTKRRRTWFRSTDLWLWAQHASTEPLSMKVTKRRGEATGPKNRDIPNRGRAPKATAGGLEENHTNARKPGRDSNLPRDRRRFYHRSTRSVPHYAVHPKRRKRPIQAETESKRRCNNTGPGRDRDRVIDKVIAPSRGRAPKATAGGLGTKRPEQSKATNRDRRSSEAMPSTRP